MIHALSVVLAGLPESDVRAMKKALEVNPGPPLFLVAAKKQSHIRRSLVDAEDKRQRKKVEKLLRRNPGVPLSEWNESILSWSAGYWQGKLFQGGLSKKDSRQFKLWHDQAQAELLRRKLVN